MLKPEEISTRKTSRMFFAAPALKLPDYLDSKNLPFWQVLGPRQTVLNLYVNKLIFYFLIKGISFSGSPISRDSTKL